MTFFRSSEEEIDKSIVTVTPAAAYLVYCRSICVTFKKFKPVAQIYHFRPKIIVESVFFHASKYVYPLIVLVLDRLLILLFYLSVLLFKGNRYEILTL